MSHQQDETCQLSNFVSYRIGTEDTGLILYVHLFITYFNTITNQFDSHFCFNRLVN